MSNSPLVTYTNISKNKTSPRNHKIDTITIHCYVGQVTAKQGCDYFATTTSSSKPSSNYVIGRDGSIGLSVDEKDRANTTGGKDKNGLPIRVNGISGQITIIEPSQSK
jgi:N-acetyl-anhydromuramyl-L-alanine amidase AmpD